MQIPRLETCVFSLKIHVSTLNMNFPARLADILRRQEGVCFVSGVKRRAGRTVGIASIREKQHVSK